MSSHPLAHPRRFRPRSGRWGQILFWTMAPLLILLTVWQQASVDRIVVALERNRDARTQLESQVNALRLEADRLSSLGQVEARAAEELGLVRPGTDQIVDLVFPGSEERDGLFHLKPLVGEALAGTSENAAKR